jgi:class 3 adenylate cyclase
VIGERSTMNDRINKTSICSVLFLDIIDYSKKSDSDQIEVKIQFNDLISHSLKGVAQNDRIILDTGDGVAIALTGSPEDAMFVALTIRDGILKSNINHPAPLYVRFGINLGPVRIVSDINGQPNIIGDGINVAQRIMSFSEPNQILVSRSYYEVTSRLTQEFSEMFAFSGVKQDKHVREHEIYSVRSHKDEATDIFKPKTPKDERRSSDRVALKNKFYLKYLAPSLLAFVALFGFAKMMSQAEPVAPSVVFKQEESAKKSPESQLPESSKTIKVALIANEKIKNSTAVNTNTQSGTTLEVKSKNLLEDTAKETTKVNKTDDLANQEKLNQDMSAKEKSDKTKLAIKKAKQKAAKEKAESLATSENLAIRADDAKRNHTEVKPVEHIKKPAESVVAVKEQTKDKSGLQVFADSIKQGHKNECTQVQISMNQCH